MKDGVELFPGRMGGGREIAREALLLSFREYLAVRGVSIEPFEGRSRI
ncbi:MAG: hypothetical protein QI199_07990 [Candidatus Korarchaeota archaeon]|nr:hypothetical protein [Candidatus Korarchaeota archaeon]